MKIIILLLVLTTVCCAENIHFVLPCISKEVYLFTDFAQKAVDELHNIFKIKSESSVEIKVAMDAPMLIGFDRNSGEVFTIKSSPMDTVQMINNLLVWRGFFTLKHIPFNKPLLDIIRSEKLKELQ